MKSKLLYLFLSLSFVAIQASATDKDENLNNSPKTYDQKKVDEWLKDKPVETTIEVPSENPQEKVDKEDTESKPKDTSTEGVSPRENSTTKSEEESGFFTPIKNFFRYLAKCCHKQKKQDLPVQKEMKDIIETDNPQNIDGVEKDLASTQETTHQDEKAIETLSKLDEKQVDQLLALKRSALDPEDYYMIANGAAVAGFFLGLDTAILDSTSFLYNIWRYFYPIAASLDDLPAIRNVILTNKFSWTYFNLSFMAIPTAWLVMNAARTIAQSVMKRLDQIIEKCFCKNSEKKHSSIPQSWSGLRNLTKVLALGGAIVLTIKDGYLIFTGTAAPVDQVFAWTVRVGLIGTLIRAYQPFRTLGEKTINRFNSPGSPVYKVWGDKANAQKRQVLLAALSYNQNLFEQKTDLSEVKLIHSKVFPNKPEPKGLILLIKDTFSPQAFKDFFSHYLNSFSYYLCCGKKIISDKDSPKKNREEIAIESLSIVNTLFGLKDLKEKDYVKGYNQDHIEKGQKFYTKEPVLRRFVLVWGGRIVGFVLSYPGSFFQFSFPIYNTFNPTRWNSTAGAVYTLPSSPGVIVGATASGICGGLVQSAIFGYLAGKLGIKVYDLFSLLAHKCKYGDTYDPEDKIGHFTNHKIVRSTLDIAVFGFSGWQMLNLSTMSFAGAMRNGLPYWAAIFVTTLLAGPETNFIYNGLITCYQEMYSLLTRNRIVDAIGTDLRNCGVPEWLNPHDLLHNMKDEIAEQQTRVKDKLYTANDTYIGDLYDITVKDPNLIKKK